MRKNASIFISLTLAIVSLLIYSFKKTSLEPSNIIKTSAGLISGVKSSNSDVISYKGIPFAAPPVGDLRWKAPQPASPWQGVKKCDVFSASPMQAKPVPFMVYTPEFLIAEKPISEDCLYLNVWTRFKKGDRKPVFVWIYGGGFSSGGTSVPIYDGEALAKKGVIFISVNYLIRQIIPPWSSIKNQEKKNCPTSRSWHSCSATG